MSVNIVVSVRQGTGQKCHGMSESRILTWACTVGNSVVYWLKALDLRLKDREFDSQACPAVYLKSDKAVHHFWNSFILVDSWLSTKHTMF